MSDVADWLEARFSLDGNELGDRPILDEFQAWSAVANMSVADLCDHIAIYLAQGFAQRRLSFSFCDAVVNTLAGIALEAGPPGFYWSVYLAFDEGEYHHRGDDPGVIPSETYTRPRIEELLAGRSPDRYG